MPDAAYLAQTLVNGLSVGCIYGLIGIGFCVIYNASGIVNFAQGAFVMLGGMVTFILLTSLGLPMIVAGVLAVIVVAALGVIIERLVVRPLWDRNATMFVMILATLAAQIVIERTTKRSMITPSAATAITASAPATIIGSPSEVSRTKVTMPPSITNAPCAKFTIPLAL